MLTRTWLIMNLTKIKIKHKPHAMNEQDKTHNISLNYTISIFSVWYKLQEIYTQSMIQTRYNI